VPEISEVKSVSVRPIQGVQVIKVRGKLALGCPPLNELRERLAELSGQGEFNWLLDLQEVNMLDSSGVGLLAQTMTSARNGQGACKLLNLQKFPMQVLKMVSMLALFEVYDDQNAAVESFSTKR
jgi:anti-sigma B factor antagonist